MCVDMHGQECVSIHIRRISNEPAENYNPDITEKRRHTHVCEQQIWILHIQINSIMLRVPRIRNKVSKVAMRLLNKAQDTKMIIYNEIEVLKIVP